MVKTNPNSVIEIWNSVYINNLCNIRSPEDKDAIILQIEVGTDNDYIVEILRPCTIKNEDIFISLNDDIEARR